MFTFSHFDTLAFFSGTGALTAAGGGLINSAVLVAFIVLLTKLVEWRINASARRKAKSESDRLARAMEENNRLLAKLAGEASPQTD
jgi:hypothetical protein